MPKFRRDYVYSLELLVLDKVRFLSVIPVTLSGTGHPMLDEVQFVLRICNSRTLEVLDLSWEPVAFRADSSMGFIEAKRSDFSLIFGRFPCSAPSCTQRSVASSCPWLYNFSSWSLEACPALPSWIRQLGRAPWLFCVVALQHCLFCW